MSMTEAVKIEKEIIMNNISELVPVGTTEINEKTVNTVNARELHSFLEVGRKFNTWIQQRIEKYGFVENDDFLIISQNRETIDKNDKLKVSVAKEYFITLDMAKELAMVENNDKGREARKYFIECEKQLQGLVLPLKDSLLLGIFKASGDINKALAINAYEEQYVRPLEESVERMKPKEEFYDAVTQSEATIDVGNAAKLLGYKGMGRNNLYRFLREVGVLNHKNIPYQQYITQGYFKLVEQSWINPRTQDLEVVVKIYS